MSRLDLVVFGATGFTGKKTVEELARGGKEYDGLSWGIAGRSQHKLDSVVAEVSKITGKNLSQVKIIIADVADEKSLTEMCSQAKVVVNCCGPYRLYGEPVVRAAIHSKTHYVDVSGEPQFIETMQIRYNKEARDAGVFIISACGFDSIPNDMGVIFLQQAFSGGVVNSVESYLSSHVPPEFTKGGRGGYINNGTWQSLVHSIAHSGEVVPLRKQMYPERLPTFKPKLQPRSIIHKKDSRWCLPFLGADGSIVYRTQRTLYEDEGDRPVQFKAYVKLPSFAATLLLAFAGVMVFIMSKIKFTRQLLLNYPGFFTGGLISSEEPSEEIINNTHFSFELFGRGWAKNEDVHTGPPTKTMTVKVTGVNPGYGATVVALIHSALTILREQDQMPTTKGVMTTGVAFRNTGLIKRLHEHNLKFEIVHDKSD